MNWTIDHIAVTAHDWPRSVSFYETVFDMCQTKFKLVDHPDLADILGPNRFAHMLDPLGSSLHVLKAIPNFYARYPALKKDFTNCHLALTIDDLDGLRARFDAQGLAYEVPREWGPTGYVRLYVDDPFMNVIEPNQRVGSTASPAAAQNAAGALDRGASSWRIDHINLVSFDIERSATWFSEMLNLRRGEPSELPAEQRLLYDVNGHNFAFFPEDKAGRPGIHLSVPDAEVTAKRNWWLNPLMRGHTAITVQDLDTVMERLRGLGVRFQDCGGVEDKRILYTYDPAMNVLEVNQDI